MEPSLSTIDQPGFEMGQEAARLLIRQIELKVKDQYEAVEEIKVLKTRLIIRNSSLKKQVKKK
jgi:LacI family transcriptional regulator